MANPVIKIKTPNRCWQVKNEGRLNSVLKEMIEKNVARITLNRLSDVKDAAIRQQIRIYATFFQRVVSRTPLDESYSWVEETESGELIERYHEKDEIQCRYDWYISDGKTKITAKELYQNDNTLFDYVSDAEAISKLADIFASRLRFTVTNRNIAIYNDNPHFMVLEYGGGYNWGINSQIKQGPDLEHGVVNNHSVQAPVGMLRITEMELQRSSDSSAKTALDQRFKGQKVRTYKNGITRARALTPSDYQLKQIVKLLKNGKITFEDIERYIGER